MENKKQIKRRSNNYLTCAITGAERMSNKTYIANKAEKKGTTVEEFKKFYITKDAYKALKDIVQVHGLDMAANEYSKDRDTIKSYMSMNGRGRYTLPKAEETVASKEWKGLDIVEGVEVAQVA